MILSCEYKQERMDAYEERRSIKTGANIAVRKRNNYR